MTEYLCDRIFTYSFPPSHVHTHSHFLGVTAQPKRTFIPKVNRNILCHLFDSKILIFHTYMTLILN